MHIEIGTDGKVSFQAPQQQWNAGQYGEDKGVMETANFAGQRLMAITDGAEGFELHYLGFKAGGFKTMEEAKQAAPEFTLSVLARMIKMIG